MAKQVKIVKWKFALFMASIAAIVYGLVLIGNLYLNTPVELKDQEKTIPLQQINFDCGDNQLKGIISSNNDFLSNKSIMENITVNTSNNDIIKIKATMIPNEIENTSIQMISSLTSFYNQQSFDLKRIGNSTIFDGQKDLNLARSGSYSILLSEYDVNNKLICAISFHNQFSVISDDDELQIRSEKEVIRNGIVMEALSWIVAGATGVIFLTQIGLEE